MNTIYAGTPLDTNGKPVMDSTAVGIVAADLHAPDKTATVITAGTWDESVNEAQFHITEAVKLALSNITFSKPPVIPLSTVLEDYVTETALGTTLADYAQTTDLASYVQKTDTATTEAAGVVLQAVAIEDLTEAPAAADFNGLLDALRDSGVIATADETPAET